MKIIEFTFILGIIFIIFNMIWSIFTLILQISSRGVGKVESHIHRVVQGYFLASLTAIGAVNFYEAEMEKNLFFWYLIGGFFLIVYLTSKSEERKKTARVMVQINNFSIKPQILKYEWIIILAVIGFYFTSFYYHNIIDIPLNHQFYSFIQGVFQTPIIGWIIGLIGCFFFLSMISRSIFTIRKSIQSVLILLGIVKESKQNNDFDSFEYSTDENGEDIYVDYEEVEDDEEDK